MPSPDLGVSHHGRRAGRSGHRPRREHATHPPPPPRRGRPGCGHPTWAPTATCCRASTCTIPRKTVFLAGWQLDPHPALSATVHR
ncbi:hypothetical protein ScPMuIL_006223 [Solemya velum]